MGTYGSPSAAAASLAASLLCEGDGVGHGAGAQHGRGWRARAAEEIGEPGLVIP